MTSVLCTSDGGLLASSLGNGILFSADGGATWSGLNDGLRSLNVWELTEDSKGDIFASTANGVHRLTGYRAAHNAMSKAVSPGGKIISQTQPFA